MQSTGREPIAQSWSIIEASTGHCLHSSEPLSPSPSTGQFSQIHFARTLLPPPAVQFYATFSGLAGVAVFDSEAPKHGLRPVDSLDMVRLLPCCCCRAWI